MEEQQQIVNVKRLFHSEKLWHEIILFGFLFGALFLQEWTDVTLPLFAIFLFSMAFFSRCLQVGQEINYSHTIEPLATIGIKKEAVDRIELTSVLTLLTVLIQGYESLAQPQMNAMLAPYFLELLLITYLLGHYWLFAGLQANGASDLEMMHNSVEEKDLDNSYSSSHQSKNILLQVKIATFSAMIIAIIFGVGTIFNVLTASQVTPALLISVPGSDLTHGTQVPMSGVMLAVLIIPLIASGINLFALLKTIQVSTPELPLNIERQMKDR